MFKAIVFFTFLFTSINVIASSEDNTKVDDIILRSKALESNYSINVNWINNVLDKDQRYILPGAQNSAELHEKYLKNPQKWADINPRERGGSVCIWYDST